LPAAAQGVQKSINEANVLIAAAANVVAQDMKDGILTKPQAQAYADKLKEFSQKADQAQALLAGGNILDAKNQAELLSALILALHREVVARRKP
jgi:soluble cytochrome b562